MGGPRLGGVRLGGYRNLPTFFLRKTFLQRNNNPIDISFNELGICATISFAIFEKIFYSGTQYVSIADISENPQ